MGHDSAIGPPFPGHCVPTMKSAGCCLKPFNSAGGLLRLLGPPLFLVRDDRTTRAASNIGRRTTSMTRDGFWVELRRRPVAGKSGPSTATLASLPRWPGGIAGALPGTLPGPLTSSSRSMAEVIEALLDSLRATQGQVAFKRSSPDCTRCSACSSCFAGGPKRPMAGE